MFLAMLSFTVAGGEPYQRPGITERVSVANDGSQGNSWSQPLAMSADARFVAFTSNASNLVPGDTNGYYDVFVRDRVAGTTRRVSVASDGTQANLQSGFGNIAMSGNGRYALFTSAASNLVADDTNNDWDVFVHDLLTGVTERISVASDGTQADFFSGAASINFDGRYVAFESAATNLVPGNTYVRRDIFDVPRDIFVRDRVAGTTERVSVASDGTQADNWSWFPDISPDGRFVAFQSQASNLVPGDPTIIAAESPDFQVYVHDRETGTTEMVSIASDGTRANGSSWEPSLSADARYVAFRSLSSNLVPADANRTGATLNGWDIFVHDRYTGTTERISVASDGTEANGNSAEPKITPDGRHVTFESDASNLVAGDTNGQRDIFVHDRLTGKTERVSIAGNGMQANDVSGYDKAISADGRYVAFRSAASNLVPGDTSGPEDTFVRYRGPTIGIGEVTAAAAGGQFMVEGWATYSGLLLANVEDPSGDGASNAQDLGGELVGASLAYRPEQADLLVRLRVDSLPSVQGPAIDPINQISPGSLVPGIAGVPGVLYKFSFQTKAARYEARAGRADGPNPFSVPPQFTLYRCAPECVQAATLKGGLGTTDDEVVMAIPLQALGVAEGGALTNLRAFTAVENSTAGTVTPLDELLFGSATIPTRSISVGIAPPGVSGDAVNYTPATALNTGAFSAVIAGPPDGSAAVVWALACLGATCGPAVSWPRAVNPPPNLPPIARLTANPTRGAAPLTVAFDASTSSDPDPGDSISSFTMSFDDGTPAETRSTPLFSHTYQQTGIYTAMLIVTDSHGRQSGNNAEILIDVRAPATAPGAPTIGTATPGNGQVSIAFTPPGSNGGAPITRYTATCDPGAFTANGAASPITVTDLANGTTYICSVTATNTVGTSAPSAPVSVIPAAAATIPGTPTIGAATPGNGQASIAFTPPGSNGGAPITRYTATCDPGAFTANGAASPITVTGLANGTTYICSVTATNAVGTSTPSATVSVTPTATAAAYPFAESAVATGGALRNLSQSQAGVMGTLNGAFRPDDSVTRVSLAYSLVQSLALQSEAQAFTGNLTVFFDGKRIPIVDAESIPASLRGYVQLALDRGLINARFAVVQGPYDLQPTLQAYFDPATIVTRAAFAVAAGRYRAHYLRTEN